MKKLLILVFASQLNFGSLVLAQEAVTIAGGNASGSGGSASYTVGQIVYTTKTGSSGSVAQGVQQPFEISVVSGINEIPGILLQCSVYPNPTTDLLILKIDASATPGFQSLSYQIYDMNGKLLLSKKLTGNETSISMENLVPATYFLKVIQSDKEVKAFKIIKK
jgi:hypothetical protein